MKARKKKTNQRQNGVQEAHLSFIKTLWLKGLRQARNQK